MKIFKKRKKNHHGNQNKIRSKEHEKLEENQTKKQGLNFLKKKILIFETRARDYCGEKMNLLEGCLLCKIKKKENSKKHPYFLKLFGILLFFIFGLLAVEFLILRRQFE